MMDKAGEAALKKLAEEAIAGTGIHATIQTVLGQKDTVILVNPWAMLDYLDTLDKLRGQIGNALIVADLLSNQSPGPLKDAGDELRRVLAPPH